MNATDRAMSWVLAGLILAVAGAAWGQDRVTGTVVALVNEKCGLTPGSCEGSLAFGEPGHTRTVRVKAGRTSISQAGKRILLEDVRLGDQVSIELADSPDTDVAKTIEVASSDHDRSPSDHHSDH
jgi:hypothetical protein